MIGQEKFFENYFNSYTKVNLCHTCGNPQHHNLIWCEKCGTKFCSHQHTMLEAMKIAKDIRHIPKSDLLSPRTVAIFAAFWIKQGGFYYKDYEEFLQRKLEDGN